MRGGIICCDTAVSCEWLLVFGKEQRISAQVPPIDQSNCENRQVGRVPKAPMYRFGYRVGDQSYQLKVISCSVGSGYCAIDGLGGRQYQRQHLHFVVFVGLHKIDGVIEGSPEDV